MNLWDAFNSLWNLLSTEEKSRWGLPEAPSWLDEEVIWSVVFVGGLVALWDMKIKFLCEESDSEEMPMGLEEKREELNHLRKCLDTLKAYKVMRMTKKGYQKIKKGYKALAMVLGDGDERVQQRLLAMERDERESAAVLHTTEALNHTDNADSVCGRFSDDRSSMSGQTASSRANSAQSSISGRTVVLEGRSHTEGDEKSSNASSVSRGKTVSLKRSARAFESGDGSVEGGSGISGNKVAKTESNYSRESTASNTSKYARSEGLDVLMPLPSYSKLRYIRKGDRFAELIRQSANLNKKCPVRFVSFNEDQDNQDNKK